MEKMTKQILKLLLVFTVLLFSNLITAQIEETEELEPTEGVEETEEDFEIIEVVEEVEEEKSYYVNEVDEFPIIKGCENAEDKKKCFDSKVLEILNNYEIELISERSTFITARYTINSIGKVSNVYVRPYHDFDLIYIYTKGNRPKNIQSPKPRKKDTIDYSGKGLEKLLDEGFYGNFLPQGNYISELEKILTEKLIIVKPAQIRGNSVSMGYFFKYKLMK